MAPIGRDGKIMTFKAFLLRVSLSERESRGEGGGGGGCRSLLAEADEVFYQVPFTHQNSV